MNFTDPFGLDRCNEDEKNCTTVTAKRIKKDKDKPKTPTIEFLERFLEDHLEENDIEFTDEQREEFMERSLDIAVDICVADWDGATLGLTGAGAMAAGLNILSTPGKPSGATKGTSIASKLGRGFDSAWKSVTGKRPMMPSKPHINSLTLNGGRHAATIGGAAGRAVPLVGAGLLGSGAGIVSGCNTAVKGE